MRRVVGFFAIVIGLTLCVGTVAIDAFGRAASGQRLLDGARPTMSDDVARLRNNLDTLVAGTDEFFNGAIPAISAELGTSPTQLLATLSRDYPKFAALLSRREEITTALDRTVVNLEAHADDFESADDLPAPGVSLRIMPYVLFVTGAAILVSGIFTVRTRDARALWVLVGLGALLLVPTLALQVPQKSADAEDLINSLNITSATATRTRDQFDTTAAALEEQRTAIFPDTARALRVSAADFVSTLAREFPALGKSLSEIDQILGNINAEVQFRETSIDEFADVRDLPLTALSWSITVIGLILLAAAAIALKID